MNAADANKGVEKLEYHLELRDRQSYGMQRRGIRMKIKEGILVLFLALNALNDIRSRRIWLRTAWVFGVVGVIYVIYKGEMSLAAATGALLPGAVFLIIGKITNEAVGYGDGIVIIVMGIYLGLWATVSSIMLALLLSALWAIVLTIFCKKKKEDSFAFLPFLLLGYIGGLWI